MLGILITLLLYFCLISWIAYRKKGDEEDYYQVKKAVPVTVLAFSVFATLLSPISFLTLVGNAYTGRSYLWFAQCGIFLAIPLAHRYFLPLYQKENYETAYHLLEDKFQSAGIRSLASGLFILYQLGRIAVVTYLLSQALEPFIPINQLVLSGLLLLLTVYYLARGGLLVVLWTDFFQGLVLLAILALFLPRIAQSGLIMNSSQQLSHFAETLDGQTILILVVGAGFSSLFSYVSSQDIVQRFNSKMGRRKIGKILWLQGLLSFGIASLLYLIGCLIRQENFATTSTNPVLIAYAREGLAPWFGSFIMLALLAAGQSTVSSSMNAIVTCLKLDFAWSKIRWSPSLLSFALAGLSWLLCLLLMNAEIYSIYEWINGFMGLTLGVIGGLYLLVLLLKKPSLQLAKIYLVFSLGALVLYHYSGLFANPNPWLNSIITTLSALFISILGRLYESKN